MNIEINHALMDIIKLLWFKFLTGLIVISLFFSKVAYSQVITLSAPATGEYSSNKSITLLPGFSTSGPFHAYITAGLAIPLSSSPSQDQNYVRDRIYKIQTLSEFSDPLVSQLRENIQYFDGLGRPMQKIQTKGSPLGNDIVQPIVYDVFGRESVKYLPYAEQSGGGAFRSSALSTQSNFYGSSGWDATVVKTSAPYSQTVYEASPLDKVMEQGAPGGVWQPAAQRDNTSGRTVAIEYDTNNNSDSFTTDGYAVRLWISSPVAANDYRQTLSTSGYYSKGELSLKITKDENWTSSKGKEGTAEEYIDKVGHIVLRRLFYTKDQIINVMSTYYVYDDFDNLSFVLPPGANPDAASIDQNSLDRYCYQYRYDGRRRIIEKKIPGKGWDKIVYNKLDQVVLTQDSVQRVNGQWLFNKYDGLGRSIISGLYNDGSTRSTLEATVDAQTSLWETRQSGDVGYTSVAFPQTINYYHSIQYYDDYSFTGASNYPYTVGSKTKGLLTGTRTTVLGTGDMLLGVNYYDEEGRLAKVYKQHYLSSSITAGNYDEITNSYNFEGMITASIRVHHNAGGTTNIASRYEYDHIGRKMKTYEQISSGSEVTLSENNYNEIGQLASKDISDAAQNTSYSYNERGWLKKVVSPQFSETLNYEDGTAPQWNGNIANQSWGKGSNLGSVFTYTYDAVNRLTTAVSTGIVMSESLIYDGMGNISQIIRDGQNGNYSYTGNQLNGISGGLATGIYSYDGNGNMIIDGRNSVTLTYNALNLPQTVAKSGLNMSYIYDASGQKLKKISGTTSADYIDGIQYTNNVIDFIQTEVGLARNNNGTYSYEYNLSDHLGNVRVSIYKNPITGSMETTQESDYYAFGLRKVAKAGLNKYLYNNKELQEELGQYDYEARFYDPIIGRFTTVDPLAEKSTRFSPYVYGNNNPIRFIDLDGMEGTDWVKGKNNIYWDKNANDQGTTKAGDKYLGKDLTFTFNSYINDTFDGPNPPWGATGDKLTSTIKLTSNEDADGNLTSVDVKSSYDVKETGGLSVFKGRDYFPGLGEDQNKDINITNSNGFNATFEQHASVPGLEAAGLALLGYSAVNVAQKMTLGLSGNNLSVSAATDVFPSATLSVNGNKLFHYNQPSFKATHGNDLINFGTSTNAPNIIRRPAPNFYNRYNK